MSNSQSPGEINVPPGPPMLGYLPQSDASGMVWCRLLAVFMLGCGLQQGLSGLVNAIDYLVRAKVDIRLLAAVIAGSTLQAAVWLVLAWYCWAKAPSLSERMVEGRGENVSPRGMRAGELLSIVIIGVGIYLLTEALPTIGWWIYSTWGQARAANEFRGTIVVAVIRSLLGLWMILGTRGIAMIIRKYGGKWRDQAD